MELIKSDTKWFLSSEGKATFEDCKNLEERSVFIYSYLKTIAVESLEKDSFLFRIAFLLADSVHSSSTSYAAFPALLDASKNPFVAYVQNAKKVYSKEANYCILLSILHEIADPFNPNDWIYDQSLFANDGYIKKLKSIEKCFIEDSESLLVNEDVYEIDNALRDIQIETAWLFILAEKEGK